MNRADRCHACNEFTFRMSDDKSCENCGAVPTDPAASDAEIGEHCNGAPSARDLLDIFTPKQANFLIQRGDALAERGKNSGVVFRRAAAPAHPDMMGPPPKKGTR